MAFRGRDERCPLNATRRQAKSMLALFSTNDGDLGRHATDLVLADDRQLRQRQDPDLPTAGVGHQSIPSVVIETDGVVAIVPVYATGTNVDGLCNCGIGIVAVSIGIEINNGQLLLDVSLPTILKDEGISLTSGRGEPCAG